MESQQITIPTRPKRKFVSENLVIDSWDKIKSLFDNLLNYLWAEIEATGVTPSIFRKHQKRQQLWLYKLYLKFLK